MAALDKIKSEENSLKTVVDEDLAEFLVSKDLLPISLILLDVFLPFERFIKVMLTISEPLAGLFFGENAARKIAFFSSRENSFTALKEALERGKE
ncbi:hypothetical protein J6Z19_06875 [bacterium]|nr:hypothetical protein [bacterium]